MTKTPDETLAPTAAGPLKEEGLHQTLFEAAPSAMAGIAAEGVIVFANREVERMFGYARGELVGRSAECLIPKPFPEAKDVFGTTALQGHGNREASGRSKDGSEFPLEVAATLVERPDGPLLLVSFNDVSGHRSIEGELRRTIEELETQSAEAHGHAAELRSANQELEEFSYAASHDLKEPLRNLLAYGELLKEDLGDDLPADAAQDLEFITAATARMQRLVEDLLLLSRAGRARIDREDVSLEDCVAESLQALAKILDDKGVTYEKDPLPRVSGDRKLLAQVYQHLLANAVKFHHPGATPHVRLTAEDRGTEWLLGVRDNGVGIAPEHNADIFAPFKRLHGMGEFEGTGVGLAICRKLVELHGGRIWVESGPSHGANFRFTIPVAES